MNAAQQQLAAAAAAALARHAPFDRMEAEALRRLASQLAVSYFARGSVITGPDAGPAAELLIVKSGRVAGAGELLEAGECFPVAALVSRQAPAARYEAELDTLCWRLPARAFRELLDLSEVFRAFCTDRLAALLEQARRAAQAEDAAALADAGSMLAPLRTLMHRPAVSCAPETPVAEAARTMHAERVGSIVVVDGAGAPIGVFTTVDLLQRVASPQLPHVTPIRSVMTPHPIALEQEAPILDAATAMARHGIRHVVVTRDGRLAGVVSERDLFALQRTSLGRTAERIRGARDAGALRGAADEIRALSRRLLAQGVSAEQMTAMVSTLNDALTQRIVALAAERHALPGRWCWLALGSEGRMEQTLVTDQDNALVFDAAASERPRFLAFADEANRALAACGFPLCEGDIMARNPRWCLSPAEWRRLFDDWIRNPVPDALLGAAIFFDFRPLAGEAQLAGALRDAVLAQARASPAFCRAMAHNALAVRPPLGWVRDFSADALDLKLNGSRLFVDAARVLALARGGGETATAARLRSAGEPAASVDAFHFIQALRLRSGGNRVAVGALGAVERRILKEALLQAARLQARLEADYP